MAGKLYSKFYIHFPAIFKKVEKCEKGMDTNMKTDTIAAIATAMSDSGIGIIRVSGEDAINIVDKIYRNPKNQKSLTKYPSHTIHYGLIV